MSYLESSTLYSYVHKENELYLKILELILSREVIDKKGTMIIYKKESCLYYKGENNNVRKSFKFKYGENIFNIWPGDYEIIDDVKNYIKVNYFDVLNGNAEVDLELYIDRYPSKKKNIHLKKMSNFWKIV